MATDTESFNKELYDLLKVRGYKPIPLDAKNQRVPASQTADVIEFHFTKDGEDFGKAWLTIDDAQNVVVYYDDEQQNSPSSPTPGVEYDDSWTGFLKHLKNWAQRRQLSFELANKDRLGDDMRQREYYKMKEKLGESYHPMGKKSSYNDAVPNVKIVLQHNRALEEGEARFRNVAKIYLENAEGERFLAPTTRPGVARVYARHIAEGGVPNDERWNHIKSICEDYNKMAGFVRATKNGQFNESVQQLVNEGAAYYTNLRETLHKLTGHRGYHAYFESWTPSLMEGEGEDISEMFMSSSLDPRIEAAMPILSRIKTPVTEMEEVDSLAEWADDIINEKLDLDEPDTAKAKPKNRRKPFSGVLAKDFDDQFGHYDDLGKIGKLASSNRGAEDDMFWDDESWVSDVDEGLGDVVKKGVKSFKRGMKGWEKGMHDVDTVKAATKTLSPDSKEAALKAKVGKGSPAELQQKLIKREKNKQVDEVLDTRAGKMSYAQKNMDSHKDALGDFMNAGGDEDKKAAAHKTAMKRVRGLQSFVKSKVSKDEVEESSDKQGDDYKAWRKKNFNDKKTADDIIKGSDTRTKYDLDEDLGPEQKKVGQLGPTSKVKNNNIGKLVGASESMNHDDEDLLAEGILDTIKSRVKSFLPKAKAAPAEPKRVGTVAPAQPSASGLNDYIKKIATDLNAADQKTKIALVKELVGVMADRKGYPEWDNVIGSVKGILKRAGVNPNLAAAASAKLQAGQTFESAMQEAINVLLESTGLTMQILNEGDDDLQTILRLIK